MKLYFCRYSLVLCGSPMAVLADSVYYMSVRSLNLNCTKLEQMDQWNSTHTFCYRRWNDPTLIGLCRPVMNTGIALCNLRRETETKIIIANSMCFGCADTKNNQFSAVSFSWLNYLHR